MTKIYRKFIKRPVDFSGAFLAMAATLPVWLLVCIALAFQNKGKIFFRQQRIGKNGKPFYILKFKSMNDRKDKNGELLADHQRMTKVGKWVRLLSLDELPQFLNILKGEMSFIGPRPLLPEYLPLYSKKQMRRHEVTPGITGWAQCHGRNALSWGEKFDYDVWYVDNQSFSTDCKIVALTIKTIFDLKNSNSYITDVEKFNGHN